MHSKFDDEALAYFNIWTAEKTDRWASKTQVNFLNEIPVKMLK